MEDNIENDNVQNVKYNYLRMALSSGQIMIILIACCCCNNCVKTCTEKYPKTSELLRRDCFMNKHIVFYLVHKYRIESFQQC